MKSFIPLLLGVAVLAGCSNNQDATPTGTNITSTATTATPPSAAPAANSSDPKSAGEAFLAANSKQAGVITTASGLQYKVIKSGTGASPKASDTVKVNYEGKLIDGTIFDSSIQRGEPASFPVNAVIAGWTEALQLMKVGDKWQLFIPANLAYGPQSPSPAIPPNSTLIFEVELLDIAK